MEIRNTHKRVHVHAQRDQLGLAGLGQRLGDINRIGIAVAGNMDPADDIVDLARPAVDDVVTGTGLDQVVATVAEQAVAPVAAQQEVGVIAAGKGVVIRAGEAVDSLVAVTDGDEAAGTCTERDAATLAGSIKRSALTWRQ